MEDTTKITKKVVNPATTTKAAKEDPVDDGLLTVEYTRRSVNFPGRAKVPKPLAIALEKSGKAVIIKN